MRGRIPNNFSKAGWEIKNKLENPESAIHTPSLLPTFSRETTRQRVENSYAAYCDNTALRLHEIDRQTCKGRPAGSRIIWDKELEIYRIA